MKNQNIILPAIVSTALATSALAQQVVVISDADEAEALVECYRVVGRLCHAKRVRNDGLVRWSNSCCDRRARQSDAASASVSAMSA